MYNERENHEGVLKELEKNRQVVNILEKELEQYESQIFEKENYIDSLANQKMRLSTRLENLENNFSEYRKTVIDENRIILNEESKLFKSKNSLEIQKIKSESDLLMVENCQLKEENITLKHFKEISEKRICSFQNQIEELEYLVNNFRQVESKRVENDKEHSFCGLDLDMSLENIPEVASVTLSTKFYNLETSDTHRKKSMYDQSFSKNNTNRKLLDTMIDGEDNTYNEKMLKAEKPREYIPESKTIMNLPKEISFIIFKQDDREGFRFSYSEIVYQCFSNHKVIKLLLCKNDVLYVTDRDSTKKPLIEVHFSKIKDLKISRDNANVMEIVFSNERSKNELIVLENSSSIEFIRFLDRSQAFDSTVKRRGTLEIESVPNFKNAALNLFKSSAKKSGFLDRWINNFFYEWRLFFVIQIGNVLLRLDVPEHFKYQDFNEFRTSGKIYRLEDYNIIVSKQKIGLNKETTFAIKVKNEGIDLVFSAPSAHEKALWIESLSDR